MKQHSSTANYEWLRLLRATMLANEVFVNGSLTREIMGQRSCIDMMNPCVTIPERKLNEKFMAAEALSILTGDNSALSMKKHIQSYPERFTKNGRHITWHYGPKVVDQIYYCQETLVNDPMSRRAVMNIWRENPRWDDPPCTLSLQFLIRNDRLNCVTTMRSNDLWLGFPYDVFCFTMITTYLSLLMGEQGRLWRLGDLILCAGSSHIYVAHWEAVNHILNKEAMHQLSAGQFSDIDVVKFNGPDGLLNDLATLSNAP